MNICNEITAAVLHVASVHSAPGFEALTPGIAMRCDTGIQIGAFRNSVAKTSLYASYLHDVKLSDYLGVWGALGVATGYDWPVVPIAIGGLKIGPLRVGYIPPVGAYNPGHTISFAFEVEL
jgi:hypothetical protein